MQDCFEKVSNENSPFCEFKTEHRKIENFPITKFLFKLHSVPKIEFSEAPFRDSTLQEKAAPSPRQTWLTFLKRELEFLGVSELFSTSIKIRTSSRKEH